MISFESGFPSEIIFWIYCSCRKLCLEMVIVILAESAKANSDVQIALAIRSIAINA
jgi:hypothetical protein